MAEKVDPPKLWKHEPHQRIKVFCFFFSKKKALLFEKRSKNFLSVSWWHPVVEKRRYDGRQAGFGDARARGEPYSRFQASGRHGAGRGRAAARRQDHLSRDHGYFPVPAVAVAWADHRL